MKARAARSSSSEDLVCLRTPLSVCLLCILSNLGKYQCEVFVLFCGGWYYLAQVSLETPCLAEANLDLILLIHLPSAGFIGLYHHAQQGIVKSWLLQR